MLEADTRDLSVPHERPRLPKARNGCPAESTPAGLPRPFIADHRGHLVIAIYALVVTTLVAVIARVSGSITTACVFAALVTAAASILVLPAVMVLLCAAEALETHWLCRRHEGFRRWLESRQSRATLDPVMKGRPGARAEYWRTLTPPTLQTEVARLLESTGCRVERVPGDEEAGVDLVASRGSGRAVVRCWAELERCGPALARELLAAREDFEADQAVIIAPAGGSPRLQEYRQRRRFLIVDADDLAEAELNGGLDPFEG